MSSLKVGALAIVIRGQLNVGRLVRLEECLGHHDKGTTITTIPHPDVNNLFMRSLFSDVHWMVVGENGPLEVVVLTGAREGEIRQVERAPIPACRLMPLWDKDEQEETQQSLTKQET